MCVFDFRQAQVAGSSPAALTNKINNLRPNTDQTEELRVTPRVTRVTLIRVRRALALPIYTLALVLSHASDLARQPRRMDRR